MNTAPVQDRLTRCGLYVHLPFCETKCGYCDFFSVPLKGRATRPLVQRVARELQRRLSPAPHPIRTVFVGGGTPTILPADELAWLLDEVRAKIESHLIEEFTVEANPATVDDAKAAVLVQCGVTRVSMGAQSFIPEELTTLERLHSPDDIAPSVQTLRRRGVTQINLDLIFGIPGQTCETWKHSLESALELEPDHIACYGLTYEPGTRLTALRNAGRVEPCDEIIESGMFQQTVDILAAAGFEHYETSNFARPGCRCEHNLIYWRNGPYVGVGPSAAGCYAGRRYKNIADVSGYIRAIDEAGHAEADGERINHTMLMMEMVMMQLRLTEGLSLDDFRRRTGLDPRQLFAPVLENMTRQGWLTDSDSCIALTPAGRLVADVVIRDLAALCEDAEDQPTAAF
ncbi:MAG: radical SAM family heme chaperone HemW [Phycisphaerae bacterium]|nr:radical SAM family heme chaperone HemW [Phycisphaerae bacterium]